MPQITSPEAVVASFVFHPLTFPNGRTVYHLETMQQRFWSDTAPTLRDAGNNPLVLTEEVGVGSLVQIASRVDRAMRAIKVLAVAWDDPFADAADFSSDSS